MKWPFRRAGVIAVALAAVGCGPTTQSQLTRCQNEKKTLLTRIVDEQKRVESLSTQNEQLATRLSDSEKQLARLYQQSSGRYVSNNNASTITTPAVPPTSVSERPNRLIPLGSPASSSGSVAQPPLSSATRFSRSARTDEATDLATGQPSLAAPSNGRSESGWLPKSGGANRSTAEGPSTFDGTQRPSGTPRR